MRWEKLFPLGMLTFAILYSGDTEKRKGAAWVSFFQTAKWGGCPKVPNVWLDLVGSWVSVSWSPCPSHLLLSSLLQADASHNRMKKQWLPLYHFSFKLAALGSWNLSYSNGWVDSQPLNFQCWTLHKHKVNHSVAVWGGGGGVISYLDSIHRIYSQLFHQFCLLL